MIVIPKVIGLERFKILGQFGIVVLRSGYLYCNYAADQVKVQTVNHLCNGGKLVSSWKNFVPLTL